MAAAVIAAAASAYAEVGPTPVVADDPFKIKRVPEVRLDGFRRVPVAVEPV